MGRARVPQRQLPAFLRELREKGATDVHRRPTALDGTVRVTWEDPPSTALQDRDFEAELRGWIPAWWLSGAFAVLLLVVFAVIGLLTGGMAGP